jgi:bifunctional DNA-binding transcriptional regulator/antitoxin component of YhaV-PrlF toxin-antitoxin module
MPSSGYRTVQQRGEVTLPKSFRDEHDLEPGDKVYWKRHSRDNSKVIIEVDRE